MKYTQAKIESKGHVVLTGPITGMITLDDGTVYDVTAPGVEVPDEHAAELAHKIGQHYSENGHPLVPYDDDHPDGFEYDDSHYKAASKKRKAN